MSTADDGRPLGGKVAVVTGASGGIGEAIALALARAGAKVALGARRIDTLEEVRAALVSKTGALSADIVTLATDVTKREDMQRLVAHAEQQLGPVDILVNNAGVMAVEFLKNGDQDSWDRTIDVNCKGVLNGIAAVLPQMLARKSGHIVNISSDAGRKVYAGLGVYCGSKFFVEAISQALRLENVGTGLRVTSIQPGDVDTYLIEHTTADAGGQLDEEAMAAYDNAADQDVLQVDDVANAVLFALTQPPHVAVNELLVQPRDTNA